MFFFSIVITKNNRMKFLDNLYILVNIIGGKRDSSITLNSEGQKQKSNLLLDENMERFLI